MAADVRLRSPRRYGGCYVPQEPEVNDVKEGIDKKCHGGGAVAWETYKKCEARIEEKVARTLALPARRSSR